MATPTTNGSFLLGSGGYPGAQILSFSSSGHSGNGREINPCSSALLIYFFFFLSFKMMFFFFYVMDFFSCCCVVRGLLHLLGGGGVLHWWCGGHLDGRFS